ncbi:MAG: hypothetical protein DRH21_07255 [Deltaproteobacteria bacterium]|nr:MAG: hypothetical protein DRH21_07255 [Deltaproteobacteria bacterium]
MDHVAIDRFTGGGVDQMKFDDYPLPGSRDKALTLKGTVWIKKGIDEEGRKALCLSFADLRDGFLTLGGLGAIGYGNVDHLEFIEKPDWFKLPDRNTANIDFSDRRMQSPFSEPKLKNNVIYHPHTFLKPPARNVAREKNPVSHIKNKDTDGNPLWSGKITCSLTTHGPVFIPDTNNDDYFNMKEKYPDHKNYGEDNINKINEKDFSSIEQQKLKAAMDCNKKIAEAAEHNRKFLKINFSTEEREEVLKGKAPVFFVKYSSHGENGYDKDWIAFLTLEKNKKGKKNNKAEKGYIKFTGPSMVNVDSDIKKSNAELFSSIWEQKDSKPTHMSIPC